MGMDRQSMARFFDDLGEKSFRADQVTKWIHQQGAASFERWWGRAAPVEAMRALVGGVPTG